MAQRVLVTGGTGYVAGWCIVELLRRGYDVRTTVRSLAKKDAVRAAVGTQVDPVGIEFAETDLVSPKGWAAAMQGVDFVLHVASPLGLSEGDPVTPAREGALNVVRAATDAGVERVVMTSAANAASPTSYTEDSVTDETLWTDPEDPTLIPYRRSKTVAEKAAWDYIATSGGSTELTTILPGAVFGPILAPAAVGSVDLIARMLKGSLPGMPKIGLEIVDVRDLAEVHIRAMESRSAPGQRFLATGEFTWMVEMARTLKSGLGPDAAKVATRQLPNPLVRLASVFDSSLKEVTVSLGRRNRHSTAKAEQVLGWKARPAAETVLDCARSLIAAGVV